MSSQSHDSSANHASAVHSSSQGRVWLNPVLLMLLSLGCILYIAARQRADQHWQSAEYLLDQGQKARAALHYQWAIRAYYPGSAVGEQAMQGLWHLSQEALQNQQPQDAMDYLSLQRGAIRSTAWLLNPYAHWTKPVDQALQKLYVKSLDAVSEQVIKETLKADLRPKVGQSLNLILSLIAIILSLRYMLAQGLTKRLESTENTHIAMLLLMSALMMFYWALAL